MTPTEFKAWFDGFAECLDGATPTEAQFAVLKAKVALIGEPAPTGATHSGHWTMATATSSTTHSGASDVAPVAPISGPVAWERLPPAAMWDQ